MLRQALLLLVAANGVASTVFSCEEIQNQWQINGNYLPLTYACLAFQDKQTPSAQFSSIYLVNNGVKTSFAAAASSLCISGTDKWTIQSDFPLNQLDCSIEFSLMFSSASPNVLIGTSQAVSASSASGSLITLASPEGGIRLENINLASGATIDFYTGVGASTNEFLIRVASYDSASVPKTYVSFDNVISVRSNGGAVTFTYSSDFQQGATLQVGDRASVSTSGQSDNAQNLRPERNYAIFPISSDSQVNMAGYITMDPSSHGEVILSVTGSYYNETQAFSQGSVNYTFYGSTLQVVYNTSIPPERVYLNNDNFVINLILTAVPPDFTTTPAPGDVTTTPTPKAGGEPSHCGNEVSKVYLDVVILVEQSTGMGPDGTKELNAFITGAMANVRINTPENAADDYYTRVAVLQYNDKSQTIVYSFEDNGIKDFMNIDFDDEHYTDKADLDVAANKAVDLLNGIRTHQREYVQQVIIVGLTAYNEETYNALNQFKAANHKLVIFQYLQEDQEPTPSIATLASPGYSFNSVAVPKGQGAFYDKILLDLCCYCYNEPHTYKSYTIPGTDTWGRDISSGGCYHPVSLTALTDAATTACTKEDSTLASVFDENKEDYLFGLFPPKTRYWIGYTDKGSSGSYYWADGTNSSSNYAIPWASGQPKPSTGDCVFSQQTTGFNTEWTSANCRGFGLAYTCQKKPCNPEYYCGPDN